MAIRRKIVAEKWEVSCTSDGSPMWTVVRNNGEMLIMMDEEQLRDMHYTFGRMIEFIDRNKK